MSAAQEDFDIKPPYGATEKPGKNNDLAKGKPSPLVYSANSTFNYINNNTTKPRVPSLTVPSRREIEQRVMAVSPDLFLTVNFPDALVLQALRSGSDPCTAVQAYLRRTLAQWCRRRGLRIAIIRFVETKAGSVAKAAINPKFKVHAHLLVAGIPTSLRSGLESFLVRESNRLQRHAGTSRVWGPSDVRRRNSGCPWHLAPITNLSTLVAYCSKAVDLTTIMLNAHLRLSTKNRRNARPFWIGKFGVQSPAI